METTPQAVRRGESAHEKTLTSAPGKFFVSKLSCVERMNIYIDHQCCFKTYIPAPSVRDHLAGSPHTTERSPLDTPWKVQVQKYIDI